MHAFPCLIIECAADRVSQHQLSSLSPKLLFTGARFEKLVEIVRFFCNRELEPKRQIVTTRSECSTLKHAHARARDSQSHLPVLLPTCPLSRANYLRVIAMGMGQSRSWLAQAVASHHTVVQSQRDVTHSTRVLRPAGRIGYAFISLTLTLGRRASVQSAGIRAWISPCNCGASTCLPPVQHNGKRLSISCSFRPSRYLVHTSAGSVCPAILATSINPRST